MKTAFKFTIFATLLASTLAHAQAPTAVVPAQSGMSRMKAILEGVSREDPTGLQPGTVQAIATGQQSATTSADLERMDARTVDFSVKQSAKWLQSAREAYVAALPPRDRALGASVLLGDGTGGPGRIYIFVSRSMPDSLLRAYAVDAFYMGARLVVKGIRKGDTIKEYLGDAVESFNTLEGTHMAGMEINPNMFDMFKVTVVPAVVWTDRVGLDDIGSGCGDVAEGTAVAKVSLTGPDGELITVDRPECAQLPDSAYFKISGALAMPYVLERFQEAGLPKSIADGYRADLAERTGNLHDSSVVQPTGNAIAPISHLAKLDRLPKGVLMNFQERLMEANVQRGPFGPTFNAADDDDPAYRQELNEKIRHGLGL